MINKSLLLLLCMLNCTNSEVLNNKIKTTEMPENHLQASNAQMEQQAYQYDNVFIDLPTKERILYLTFDDGPSKYTGQLLDTLKVLGVKATFFVLGDNVRKNPEAFKRIIKGGHSVGNHTYDHKHFKNLSDAEILEEFKLTDEELKKFNITTKLVRIPWGNISDKQIALLSNRRIVSWSVNTDDWYFAKQDNGVDSIANRITSYCYPGAIILAHDGGGNRTKTIKGVAIAVRKLQAKGWKFSLLNQYLPQ
jgi:peptidoglycan-N-acetylglucosamine deacetylase